MLKHVVVPFQDRLLLRGWYHNLAFLCCQALVSKTAALVLAHAHAFIDLVVVCLRRGQGPKVQYKRVLVFKYTLLQKRLFHSLVIAFVVVREA